MFIVITYTLVPEPFRKCDDNFKSVLRSPVAVCLTQTPSTLLVLDADRGSLMTVRLHYPAEVKSVAQRLQKAVAVATISGVALVAEGGQVSCVDYNNVLKFNVKKAKKDQLLTFAEEHDLLSTDQLHKPPKVK